MSEVTALPTLPTTAHGNHLLRLLCDSEETLSLAFIVHNTSEGSYLVASALMFVNRRLPKATICQGRGGGLVVSVLAFYSDDPSLNHAYC